MGQLYNSHVGAVMNETLRLMPPVVSIPKVTGPSPITLTMDGQPLRLPARTFMHINVIGSARNPRYYPSSPSQATPKKDDLDDFVPARWLERDAQAAARGGYTIDDGLGTVSFEAHSTLYHPPRGAFVPFSDGVRACPGRRFAQVEITAILAVVFREWSVELDVRAWASDEEVARMGREARRAVYEVARRAAERTVRRSVSIVTLKLRAGERVPVRWVRRGEECFAGC
jgi:cytochrome P450